MSATSADLANTSVRSDGIHHSLVFFRVVVLLVPSLVPAAGIGGTELLVAAADYLTTGCGGITAIITAHGSDSWEEVE